MANAKMNRDLNLAQNDFNNRHKHFMDLASLASERCKDREGKVGACIVNDDKQIVGIGHIKKIAIYDCHAEIVAIINKTSFDVKNCVMYVTLFPCNECAKVIVQSGIKEVIYKGGNVSDASKLIFNNSEVKYSKFPSENIMSENDVTGTNRKRTNTDINKADNSKVIRTECDINYETF